MAMDASNVTMARQRVAGVLYSAEGSKTLPTTAVAEVGSDFGNLGMLSSDGITMTIDKEITELENMDGDTALTVTSKHSLTFSFSPMEFLNVSVLKEMFGQSNVTTETGGAVKSVSLKNEEAPVRRYVIDMRLRDARLMRIVIPAGKVDELGEFAFKNDEAIQSEWTVNCMPDATGVKAYFYFGVQS